MSSRIIIEGADLVYEQSQGETLLDAALRNGIPFPHACRSGACGTCKARIVEGVWEYKDGYDGAALQGAELRDGMVVSCKATARSDLRIQVAESMIAQYEEQVLETRIAAMEMLSADVLRLVLHLEQEHDFAYRPGQYLDFLLDDNRRRSYSMASRRAQNASLDFHIRHVPGGYFTDRLFEEMKIDDCLRVEGPKGKFCLQEEAVRPLIFLASGTGFAPIKSILEQIILRPGGQQVYLYWGAESPEGLYLDAVVRSWQEKYPFFVYVPVVYASGNKKQAGELPTAVVRDFGDLSSFDVYLAGAPAMIQSARDTFPAFRHPQERFFADVFRSPDSNTKSRGGFFQKLFANR